MNVLADLHHSGLYASFHYLFENRLGATLYRPIGIPWFKQGYWKIAEPYGNAEATIYQYLSFNSVPEDGTPPLNNTEGKSNGIYSVYDAAHDYTQKAITLDKFKQMNFDIVIASIPAHIDAYIKLIVDTGSKAKLVYHIGNIDWHNHIPWNKVENIMASVKTFDVPAGKNAVFYRQEFRTELFSTPDSEEKKSVVSFVNCMPRPDYFLSLEQSLKEYNFKAYGIACRDGICQSVADIAKTMRRARYGYHLKPGGDGFGHVIHNWFAAGKPILVGLDDYKDKLAGELLEDMVTCVDISHRSPEQVAGIIRELDQKGYEDMKANAVKRFQEVVNFEEDAKKVKEFIDALQ